MKPATVARLPRPRLDATRPSANEAARCSGVTRVMSSVWFAVRAAPTPGTADDRASERLPRPVDERKAGIAERARKIAGDEDRLGAKVIEQGSRGRCHEGGRAQDRGKHQTGGGRCGAAGVV